MNAPTSTSTSSNNCTHPGRDFYQKIESPPTTGEELLNWIATGSSSKLAFTSHEKAWIFNYFVQQLMIHDPRYSRGFERVDWSGQLNTLPSCLKYPKGDLLITMENGKHGFVLTKFRSNPNGHLAHKDVKGFFKIHDDHLNNCDPAMFYLVSTVKNCNLMNDYEIDVILRDDLLHPITGYTLAKMFGDHERANEMDLPSMMEEWSKEEELKIEKKEAEKEAKKAKEEDKIRREENRIQRKAEKAIQAANKAKRAAKKAKKSTKKSTKKGKEKEMNPIPEEEESSSRPKKTKKSRIRRKVVRKPQKGPRTKYYQHIKGTERVGWKVVILREIYQNHDEEGRIDVNHMTSGKRGKALYQQVTTRKYRVWQKTVRELRSNILKILRDLKKEGSVDQRNGKWYFSHPITKEVSFRELSWEQKWEKIAIFSTLFGHLPEQKDAVNPALAELWLARQQIYYAMDRRITLEDNHTNNDEEESSFDLESFLEETCAYINQNDQLFGQTNLPVLLPVAS